MITKVDEIGETWNFVNLFNEVVHVFTFDTEWDWCLPEQKLVSFFKIVLFNIVFFNVAHKYPGTPLKIRLVRYLAIGFFFIFFQKSHEIFSRFG